MEKHPQSKNGIEDEEDMEIIRAYERGEFVLVRNQKKIKAALRQLAKRHLKEHGLSEHGLKKEARINIRMAGSDLADLKRIAADEGLPYQTLISSILHKFIKSRMKDVETGKH